MIFIITASTIVMTEKKVSFYLLANITKQLKRIFLILKYKVKKNS